MKKNIFLLLFACLLNMGQVMASNVLTVSDVNVAQGGQATIEIGCEFDTEYTAFELQLSLPEGLTLLTDADGYPIIEKAFDTNHVLTGNLLPSNGNYKITCRSMENISMPTSGALLRVTVQADASLTLGANLSACITACEFTRTADSNGESLPDVDFTLRITESRTLLDELSTTMPVAEENVNVRVKRTIKANEWSTLCLPFAMSEAQVKEAFGEDVELMDFTGYEVTEDEEENIVGIEVSFAPLGAIEANHPCLIRVSEAISEFTVDGVDIDPEEEPVVATVKRTRKAWSELIGTYVAQTEVPEKTLFLSGGDFWYSAGLTKMKAFRAYFDFYDVLTEVDENYANVRFVFGEGETTGVRDAGEGVGDGIAERSGLEGVYTLQGVKVDGTKALPKGVYVVNGKKLIIDN